MILDQEEKNDGMGRGGNGSNWEKDFSFHVLVVDDDALIRHVIPRALQRLGVAVDVAENGRKAQRKILAGDFDLVITDLNMPEMNGEDLLLWVKENRPHIEGIVMSGYDFTRVMAGGLSDWVTDYLAKPFPTAVLEEAVMRSMERLKGREEGGIAKNVGPAPTAGQGGAFARS